jgi:hypothetical protein
MIACQSMFFCIKWQSVLPVVYCQVSPQILTGRWPLQLGWSRRDEKARCPNRYTLGRVWWYIMPRISAFYGIEIYMYWADHAPPHFHAMYGSEEALIGIADGSLYAGSLPQTARSTQARSLRRLAGS